MTTATATATATAYTFQRSEYIVYSEPIELELASLIAAIEAIPPLHARYKPRWLAVQLLEESEELLNCRLCREPGCPGLTPSQLATVEAAVDGSRKRLTAIYGADLDVVIASRRYSQVHELAAKVLNVPVARRVHWGDRIDAVVTHPWLGVPIFVGVMYLVFSLVQNVAAPYLNWIDDLISGPLSIGTISLLTALNAPEWIGSLLVGGIIAGVGGVLTFLPSLLVMYFALAFLEESGYLSRAAFVMDRWMGALGLHGKSFVPLILGFGCNVPAIYATRTIENRPARLLTGLLVPFMSCSARLPIYVIFGLAFFPRHADMAIWALYLVGVLVAGVVGIVLSRTVFRSAEPGIFIMELPSYRRPEVRSMLRQSWQRTGAFVRRAGTFILAVSILLWLATSLPWGVQSPRQSYFGQGSAAVATVLEPAGFGTWQSTGALITGLAAKEMVIASLAQVYLGAESDPETAVPAGEVLAMAGSSVIGFGSATLEAGRQLVDTLTPGVQIFADPAENQDPALANALRGVFTPLTAIAFLAFVLLYVPCAATIGAQAQEYGWRWAILSVFITLSVPWTVAVLIFQVGTRLGFA
jgi:ferrous iron transport protein B